MHYTKIVSVFLLLCGCPSLKGMHPRHPPRAFPLWLLAPRCLCVSFAHASWGEEVSSPRVGRCVFLILRNTRPRHPHSTLCIFMFVVSLSLLGYVTWVNFGAHPLAMDAHSGNARGGIHACPCLRVSTRGDLPARARMKLHSLEYKIIAIFF